MKPGLRLQIVLLLGGSLVLSFVPLFFAVATYTGYTLQQARESAVRALGRTIAGEVHEEQARHAAHERAAWLRRIAARSGAERVVLFDENGTELASSSSTPAAPSLRRAAERREERVLAVDGEQTATLAVVVPTPAGAVAAVLHGHDSEARSGPLIRLMGLYTALVALGLLLMAYFALTRLIVLPLGELSLAAQRVAAGARRLDVPRTRARELALLATSLRTMTERLIEEEASLRRKIEEVERATLSLAQAQEQLIRSERLASVGRLSAGLAHEIGNPLAALIGLQDLLIAGGLPEEEQRDFLERMRRETERIHRILRDLLQFARPSERGASASAEPGNIRRALEDTLGLLAPQRGAKAIQIESELAADLPEVTLGREQLVQVLLNLLLNALDASGAGGRIRVEARQVAEKVELAISDDGPGVHASVRARLFEPFVTTKEVGKGTGLGLAVCRGLVEAAGGTITFDASYGPGARFVIRLPGRG